MIVKICGLTRLDDLQAAVDGGASALGFNFWPGSPRHVTQEAAEGLLARVPAGVWKVGVFVNEPVDRVAETARRLHLDVVQLHGEAKAPAGFRMWRARSVDDDFSLTELGGGAEAFLLDAPAGEKYGGTGRTFDWSKIRGARHKIILAGGLDAANVHAAIETAEPWGVDACSRLESSPGHKDRDKMAAFLKAALARGI